MSRFRRFCHGRRNTEQHGTAGALYKRWRVPIDVAHRRRSPRGACRWWAGLWDRRVGKRSVPPLGTAQRRLCPPYRSLTTTSALRSRTCAEIHPSASSAHRATSVAGDLILPLPRPDVVCFAITSSSTRGSVKPASAMGRPQYRSARSFQRQNKLLAGIGKFQFSTMCLPSALGPTDAEHVPQLLGAKCRQRFTRHQRARRRLRHALPQFLRAEQMTLRHMALSAA